MRPPCSVAGTQHGLLSGGLLHHPSIGLALRASFVWEEGVSSLGKFPGYLGRECHPEPGKTLERFGIMRRR